MARGFCVDCNYVGPLAPTGDCPRCGSEWTSNSGGSSNGYKEDEELDTLLGRVAEMGGSDFPADDFDYYEL